MGLLYDDTAKGSVQERVELIDWEFAGGKVRMELPIGMKEMEAMRQEERYPYEGRPSMILEHEEYEIQVTFCVQDKEMRVADTHSAISKVYELVEKSFPKYKRTQVYMTEEGQIPAGWFLMQMEDMGIEHMKAVFSVSGKMALFTLSYREDEKWKWRVVLKHILASIRMTETDAMEN